MQTYILPTSPMENYNIESINMDNLSCLSDSYSTINSSDTESYLSDIEDDSLDSNKSSTNNSSNYYGRRKWSRTKTKFISEKIEKSTKSTNYEICSDNIGYTTKLSSDTPFIRFLINKRINFCQLGASSHIASFIPVACNLWQCLIHKGKGKWKSRYR